MNNSKKSKPSVIWAKIDVLSCVIFSSLFWFIAYPLNLFFMEGLIPWSFLIFLNILLLVSIWSGFIDVILGVPKRGNLHPILQQIEAQNRSYSQSGITHYQGGGYNMAQNVRHNTPPPVNQNYGNYGQKTGTYRCLCGNVQHATHWGGPRNCSSCGKPMHWNP